MSSFQDALIFAATDAQWQKSLIPKLIQAFGETLYMVSTTILIGGILGLVLGLALYTTRRGNLFENVVVYQVLNVVVNIIRPIPFIIFLTAVRPLTISVVGTSIGTVAAGFPMIIFCTVATSRIVEQNLVSADPGIIEAARSMGASRLRIIAQILIPECLAPLILGYAFIFVAVVDMSAMAGTVAGGGLGDFALQYGYREMDDSVTLVAIVVIIILVQLVQQVANIVAKRLLKKRG
ncbi:MAG: ABC transporter permease subunit [Candidatus Ancillula sp.]|nr:ABC transporter permease subunit [Candidatus Ancillula sp.]